MTDDMLMDHVARSGALAEDFTIKLDELLNRMVPTTLDNDEYVARCAGMMIAFNRSMARCATAVGETLEISPQEMADIVGKQFARNYNLCLQVVHEHAGQSVN